MSYIYKITSPSGKIYIGQSIISEHNKKQSYKFAARKKEHNNRYIINAIKKYGWENMFFEVIRDCTGYTKQELDDIEILLIAEYDSRDKTIGYNITLGGDGIDSDTARKNANRYYKNQTTDQKVKRAEACAKGQQRRYATASDTVDTRNRKSISHRREYLIESPSGKQWKTKLGLKKFAEDYADEIGISYWALFNAYRKNYENRSQQRLQYKNVNNWMVTRVV